jgi:hypothetical protein
MHPSKIVVIMESTVHIYSFLFILKAVGSNK